jgi:3-oxoacyl-[acyl-carrier-protein] synthase II
MAADKTTNAPVVSGIGILTCLGNDLDKVWSKLLKGETGLRKIENFDTSRCSNDLGGEIKGDYPVPGHERMSAFVRESIINCLNDSCLTSAELEAKKSILVFSSSLGSIFDPGSKPIKLDRFLPEALSDLRLNIPYISLSSACSSSSDAISIGADLIQYQNYDLVICGGADTLDVYKMMGHSSLLTLSETMCTPFGEKSDGTLLGEGACFLILESNNSWRKRTGTFYGRVIGQGNTTDIESFTSPDEEGNGAQMAINRAMNAANVIASDIAYINAHGSGTSVNDAIEKKVYEKLFLKSKTPISSTKGAFGHMLGATGAIESAIALLALKHRVAPPTANVTDYAQGWQDTGLIIGNEPQKLSHGTATLSVTYGFGGANVCLVYGA